MEEITREEDEKAKSSASSTFTQTQLFDRVRFEAQLKPREAHVVNIDGDTDFQGKEDADPNAKSFRNGKQNMCK